MSEINRRWSHMAQLTNWWVESACLTCIRLWWVHIIAVRFGTWMTEVCGLAQMAATTGHQRVTDYNGIWNLPWELQPDKERYVQYGTQDNGELYATSLGGIATGEETGNYNARLIIAATVPWYYFGSNKRRLVTGSEATYGLPAQVTLLQGLAFHRSNADLAFVKLIHLFIITTNFVYWALQIGHKSQILEK